MSHRIVQQQDSAWLEVGQEAWRLPIPIIQDKSGWRFDMAAAEDEILTRAIGRNELSAIQAMHAYVDAQQDFYRLNHAWAQKIISSDGKKDGLYWPAAPGAALLAWPVEWGKTGIMSFMVNQNDEVYQANLGDETQSKARAISQFSPDSGWQAIHQ